MGYRSNVHAIIYPVSENVDDKVQDFELLKTLMHTTFKSVLDYWNENDATHFQFRESKTPYLEFYCEDVKWYPEYPAVTEFEEMLRSLVALDEKFAFEFVRVGEDDKDVEVERSHNSECGLHVFTQTEVCL